MSLVNLSIKISTGTQIAVEVDLNSTVSEFKALLAEKSGIPAEQQRLIYSGHVLKDPQTLASYSIKEGSSVHLVKGAAQPQSTPSASSAATTGVPPVQPQTTPASPFGGFGGGLFPGLGGQGAPNMQQLQQQMMANPNMMSEMMNSPMMQGLLQNPELLRSILTSSPQFREVMERNPEIGHLLSDPQILRQTMEIARNPELMREMMRTSDRALSNIESHPEGFNLLRRMYTDVQEPMLNAAQQQREQVASNPFASLFGGQPSSQAGQTTGSSSSSSGNPNTAPLPNPWGGPSPSSSSSGSGASSSSSSTTGAAPNASNPFASMFGGGGQGLPPFDMNTFNSMMQNPMMQEMTQQMLSNPQLMQQLMSNNPFFSGLGNLGGSGGGATTGTGAAAAAANTNPLAALGALGGGLGGIPPFGGGGDLSPSQLQELMEATNQYRERVRAIYQQSQGSAPASSSSSSSQQQQQSTPSTTPTTSSSAASSSQPSTTPGGAAAAPPMNLFAQMLGLGNAFNAPGAFGGDGAPAPASQSSEPATVRYATQLTQLADMGFHDTEANIRALDATGGSVSASIERLLSQL